MAFSYVDHLGDGSKTAFPFRFTGDGYGYFRESDIHVFVAGVEAFNWSLTAPNQISFTRAPAIGAKVQIRRIMPKDLPYSIWKRGNDFSPLTTNNSFLQQLYALQELYDGFMTDDFRFNQNLSMGGYRITDLGAGIDPSDAVNLHQLTDVEESAGASATAAAHSADQAYKSELAARESERNTKEGELRAKQYLEETEAATVEAKASAGIAKTAADSALSSRDLAYNHMVASAESAAASFRSQDLAREAAARSAFWADRIDVNELNERIDKQDADIAISLGQSGQAAAISAEAKAIAEDASRVANAIDGKATNAIAIAEEAKVIAQKADETAELVDDKADAAVATANAAKATAEGMADRITVVDNKADGAASEAAAALATANRLGITALGFIDTARKGITLIPTGSNLDDYFISGFFCVADGVSNSPLPTNYIALEVLNYADTYAVQKVTTLDIPNGRQWSRAMVNGTWGGWVEVMVFNRFEFIF